MKQVAQVFLQVGCHTCYSHPTHSVSVLKKTVITDSNQWPGLNISSFTTELLKEGALLAPFMLALHLHTTVRSVKPLQKIAVQLYNSKQ